MIYIGSFASRIRGSRVVFFGGTSDGGDFYDKQVGRDC